MTPVIVATDSDSFDKWFLDARPGDICLYHRGFLAQVRDEPGSMARKTRKLHEAGHIALMQKRNGMEDYSYFARRK